MHRARVVVALAVGMLAVGCGGSPSSPSAESPAPATSATAEADTDNAPETVGLYAEDLKTALQVNDAFYELRNDWMNSGFTPEQLDSDDYWNLSREEFVEKHAEAVDLPYISGLFIPEWSDNASLVNFIEGLKKQHRFVMEIAYITGDPDYDDEPFRQGVELTSVVPDTDEAATKRVTSEWVVVDNVDKNRGDEFINGGSNAGETGGGTITWDLVDGKWLISNVVY